MPWFAWALVILIAVVVAAVGAFLAFMAWAISEMAEAESDAMASDLSDSGVPHGTQHGRRPPARHLDPRG